MGSGKNADEGDEQIKLKRADIRTVDEAFIRAGYVLDFSNATFSEFFEDEFEINIYAEKYGVHGGSKGWRLRTFVDIEHVERPQLVAEVLRALWLRSEDQAFEGRGTGEDGHLHDAIKQKLHRLADKLDGARSVSEGAVSIEGTGVRKDYALDPKPIGTGGAASVFSATHKASGNRVALKKLIHAHSEDARARMRREIEVCQKLKENRGVVDLLDFDPGCTWYVMPLADGDLGTLRDGMTAADVVSLFEQIAVGLRAAHDEGFLHRDLKPANILRFGSRWVIADWGLVRRPRGETTSDRTKLGAFYGTEGFAAPEAWHDAHQMTEACDVYSLGQILGWIPEGMNPVPNVSPLRSGRWAVPASMATQFEAARRPSLQEFVVAVSKAGSPPPPKEVIERMVSLAINGGAEGIDASEALGLACKVPGEGILYDVLPRLDREALRRAIHKDPGAALGAVRQYGAVDLAWGSRDFDYGNNVIEMLVMFARQAVALNETTMLDLATRLLLQLDEEWDRYRGRDAIRSLLASLSGDAAQVVAAALRGRPSAQKRVLASGLPHAVDAAIRVALS